MTGWHEDFGDSPSVEERPEYQDYLAREELRQEAASDHDKEDDDGASAPSGDVPGLCDD